MNFPVMKNYIAGQWVSSQATELLDVFNPATAEVLGQVPLSPAAEVDQAAQAAAAALVGWRRTPATERIQYLFKLKDLLEENLQDLARTITMECGKTLDESRSEMRRAIENVKSPVVSRSCCRGASLRTLPLGLTSSCSGSQSAWRRLLRRSIFLV